MKRWMIIWSWSILSLWYILMTHVYWQFFNGLMNIKIDFFFLCILLRILSRNFFKCYCSMVNLYLFIFFFFPPLFRGANLGMLSKGKQSWIQWKYELCVTKIQWADFGRFNSTRLESVLKWLWLVSLALSAKFFYLVMVNTFLFWQILCFLWLVNWLTMWVG